MSAPAAHAPESPEDVDSDLEELPSPSSSGSSASEDDDHGESDAEREWRESLQQLELLLTMVLVPYIGKYFGRKVAYWGKTCKGLDLGNEANGVMSL